MKCNTEVVTTSPIISLAMGTIHTLIATRVLVYGFNDDIVRNSLRAAMGASASSPRNIVSGCESAMDTSDGIACDFEYL